MTQLLRETQKRSISRVNARLRVVLLASETSHRQSCAQVCQTHKRALSLATHNVTVPQTPTYATSSRGYLLRGAHSPDGADCRTALHLSSSVVAAAHTADQFAFRPTGSTTAAIISLLHSVINLLSSEPYVIVISLDFSKAFDIHHCFTNWPSSTFLTISTIG